MKKILLILAVVFLTGCYEDSEWEFGDGFGQLLDEMYGDIYVPPPDFVLDYNSKVIDDCTGQPIEGVHLMAEFSSLRKENIPQFIDAVSNDRGKFSIPWHTGLDWIHVTDVPDGYYLPQDTTMKFPLTKIMVNSGVPVFPTQYFSIQISPEDAGSNASIKSVLLKSYHGIWIGAPFQIGQYQTDHVNEQSIEISLDLPANCSHDLQITWTENEEINQTNFSFETDCSETGELEVEYF